jgi:hypothetical protein
MQFLLFHGSVAYKQFIKRQSNAALSVFRRGYIPTLPILLNFANMPHVPDLPTFWLSIVGLSRAINAEVSDLAYSATLKPF